MAAMRTGSMLLLLFSLCTEVNSKAIATVSASDSRHEAAVLRSEASTIHAASADIVGASSTIHLASVARTKQPVSDLQSTLAKRRQRAKSRRGGSGLNRINVMPRDFVEESQASENIHFIDNGFNINGVFSDMSSDRQDPGFGEEEYHYKNVWNIITGVRRHKHKHPDQHKHIARPVGVYAFFGSVVIYEWGIFAIALSVFFPLFWYLQDWPSTRKFHVVALLIWIALGGLYNFAVWTRLGRNAGVMWFTGYLLEFIFSIENVFVFHIIVKAFRTPQRLTQKAVFIVVCCQVVFEMIFFMGLAARVRSMEVLPYLLGIWLLYVGYHAGKDDGHDDFNIKDSAIFRLSHWILGRRLMMSYEESGAVFIFRDRRLCVSLLFPLIFCLLAVDFFLEVDVTLTKIEELPNEYIAFTSSAAAAFAVPELFFVARDLFQRYFLLQQGVSFVLVFFGIQMLMHKFYVVPDLVGCAIIVIVMIFCMVASSFMHRKEQAIDGGQNCDVEEHVEARHWSKEPDAEPPCKGAWSSFQQDSGLYLGPWGL